MSDRLKSSRMLLRLEAEIASATTPIAADCKRAERAAYYARLGNFEIARGELDELHGRYNQNPRIEVSAWTNFAEGVLAYFNNVGVSTNDKVQRAHAIAVAAGLQPLRAVCAAWLAQWDYSKLDMESLANHVFEALRIAEPNHHSARSRANLVAAQALHLAGRPDLAHLWYRKAHAHAIGDCDDVTISALMHNMAWLRMLDVRRAVLTGEGEVGGGRLALLNAESTTHFDEMMGDSSWQELKPILRAQIVSLQGDPAQAVNLYNEYLESARGASRLQANLLADKAWCHAALGQLEQAKICASLAISGFCDDTQIDDRAAAHSRLSQVFAILEDATQERTHRILASRDWNDFAFIRSRAVSLLGGVNKT